MWFQRLIDVSACFTVHSLTLNSLGNMLGFIPWLLNISGRLGKVAFFFQWTCIWLTLDSIQNNLTSISRKEKWNIIVLPVILAVANILLLIYMKICLLNNPRTHYVCGECLVVVFTSQLWFKGLWLNYEDVKKFWTWLTLYSQICAACTQHFSFWKAVCWKYTSIFPYACVYLCMAIPDVIKIWNPIHIWGSMHKIKLPAEVAWVWVLNQFCGHFCTFFISQMVS
jgi:hypothetical protein